MKKFLSVLLAVILIAAVAVPVAAVRNLTYVAPKGTPTVDGSAEALWDGAQWTNVDLPHDGTADTDSTMKIKLLWDEQTLYFLSEVYDSDLNEANDLIEIYLDEGMQRANTYDNDDSHTRFRVFDGGLDAAGKNCKMDVACVSKGIGENKYLLEGSLKLAMPVVEGGKIGLEFMYNDGGATSDFLQAYRWNADSAGGDDLPFRNTSVFGTLTFGAPVEIEEDDDTPSSTPENNGENEGSSDDKQEETLSSTPSTSNKEESKGEANIENKVEDNKTDKTPANTGDFSNLIVSVVAMAVSVIGLAVLVIGKKIRT